MPDEHVDDAVLRCFLLPKDGVKLVGLSAALLDKCIIVTEISYIIIL